MRSTTAKYAQEGRLQLGGHQFRIDWPRLDVLRGPHPSLRSPWIKQSPL